MTPDELSQRGHALIRDVRTRCDSLIEARALGTLSEITDTVARYLLDLRFMDCAAVLHHAGLELDLPPRPKPRNPPSWWTDRSPFATHGHCVVRKSGRVDVILTLGIEPNSTDLANAAVERVASWLILDSETS